MYGAVRLGEAGGGSGAVAVADDAGVKDSAGAAVVCYGVVYCDGIG